MKILAIRGKNIASLEGEFEIDFTQEPLLSAGLYAITGPTGAGKSTLLDVLSLALYGKTPRLVSADKASIIDVSKAEHSADSAVHLMRRGASSAYAQADFVALDGDHYRATWTLHRARGKVDGAFQSVKLALYNLTQEKPSIYDKKTDIEKEVVRLTDLTFDQFTRTIVLAQGEFASFLKAKDGDRATLLEKLTGTSIYAQVSTQIYLCHEEQATALMLMQQQIDQLGLLSSEAVQVIREQLLQLTQDHEVTQLRLKEYQHHAQWFDRMAIFEKDHVDHTRLLERVLMREAGFQERRILVSQYQILWGLAEGMRKWEHQEQQQQTLNQTVQQEQSQCEQYDAQLQLLERKLYSAKVEQERILQLQPAFAQKLEQAQSLAALIDYQGRQLQQNQSQQALFVQQELVPARNALQQVARTLVELQERQRELQNWFAQYQGKELLIENYTIIVSHLNQGRVAQQRLQQLLAEVKESENNHKSLGKKQLVLTQSHLQAQQQLQEVLTQLSLPALHYDEAHYQTLRQEADAQDKRLQQLARLLEELTPLHLLLARQDELSHDLAQAQARLSLHEEELLRLSPLEKNAQLQFQLTREAFEKARQSVTDYVKQLRATLQEQEPCPVCGSLTHPYHEVNQQAALDGLIASQQQEVSRLEGLVEDLRRQRYTQEAAMQGVLQEIMRDTQKKEEVVRNIALHQANIDAMDQSLLMLSATQGVEELRAQQRDWQQQLTQARESLSRMEQCNLKRRELQKQEQEANVKLSDLVHELDLVKHSSDMLENQLQQNLLHQQQTQAELTALLNDVNDYFNQAPWQEQWKLDPVNFLAKLQDFEQKWQNQLRSLQQVELEVTGISAKQNEQAPALELLEQREKQQKEALAQQEQELQLQRQRLFDFFQTTDLAEVQSSHTKQCEQVQHQFEQAQQAYVNAQALAQRQLGSLEANKLQLKQLEATIMELQILLKDKLDEIQASTPLGYDLQGARQLLARELEYRQAMEDIQAYEQEVITLKERLAHLVSQMEGLQSERKLDIDSEENARQLQQVQDVANQQQKQLFDFTHQLKEQQDKQARQQELLHQLQAQQEVVRHWALLNSEIGMRSGDKFKKIAQGFTLDLLLRHANRYMESIAPRYYLQRIQGSLSLQVVDRYMCDQLRSVYSLSGGETFLVSLALALGLASLSSRQIHLESLFIDEGFGSLDQESLEQALAALESLQLQGRKIGVITHVREMTERITTQIIVEKKQNGASMLRIQG